MSIRADTLVQTSATGFLKKENSRTRECMVFRLGFVPPRLSKLEKATVAVEGVTRIIIHCYVHY